MLSTILFWDCIISLADVVNNNILGVYQISTWCCLQYYSGIYQISTWCCLQYYSGIYQISTWCCLQYYSGIVSDLYLMLSTILFWDCISSLPDVVNNTILVFSRSLPDVVNNTILGLYQISTWCCLQYYSRIVSDLYLILSTILFWYLADLYLMLSTILFWGLSDLYLMLSTILFWDCIRSLPDVYSGIVSDLYLTLSTILFYQTTTILFWDCIRSPLDVVYNTILGLYQISTWCCLQYYSVIEF